MKSTSDLFNVNVRFT